MMTKSALLDTSFLITDNSNTLYRHAMKLRDQNAIQLRCVKLEDGFDVALVNEDQQRELPTE